MSEHPKPHVCPWWLGYLLASPLRKLIQKPEGIVSPYLRPGMTVVEIGPGMGFFTLPMAKLVGESGRIICVDIQQKMLASLVRRAKRKGLSERIATVLSDERSYHLESAGVKGDFALLFAVVHEVPDQTALFRELFAVLKPGAGVLVAEPAGHVGNEDFAKTLDEARGAGFTVASTPQIKGSLSALLKR